MLREKGLDFVVTPCGLSFSHDKFFVCRFGSEGNAVFVAVMIHNDRAVHASVLSHHLAHYIMFPLSPLWFHYLHNNFYLISTRTLSQFTLSK